jgi:hypothetical protein
MERYELTPPGAWPNADHHWYINDKVKGFSVFVIDGELRHAEEIARFAFARITESEEGS